MRNYFITICCSIFVLFAANILHAQALPSSGVPDNSSQPQINSELPPSPVRDAILRLLRPEDIFKTLQNYIKVPLPGTGVKNIEINKGNVTELNQQVTNQTGVDLFKFFRFIGTVIVMLLEGIAKLIRGFLPSS